MKGFGKQKCLRSCYAWGDVGKQAAGFGEAQWTRPNGSLPSWEWGSWRTKGQHRAGTFTSPTNMMFCSFVFSIIQWGTGSSHSNLKTLEREDCQSYKRFCSISAMNPEGASRTLTPKALELSIDHKPTVPPHGSRNPDILGSATAMLSADQTHTQCCPMGSSKQSGRLRQAEIARPQTLGSVWGLRSHHSRIWLSYNSAGNSRHEICLTPRFPKD